MLKRTSSLLLLLCAGLFLFASPFAQAQDGNTATVTTDQLRVRAVPNGEVVGALPRGTVVTVNGRENDPNNGAVWVAISGGGVNGWVSIDFLSYNFAFESLPILDAGASAPNPAPQGEGVPAPVSAPPAMEGGVAAQITQDANVRSAPDVGAPRIGGIFAGTAVTALGRNANSSWIFVTDGALTGWVAASLIRANSDLGALPVTDAAGNIAAGQGPAPAAPPASAGEVTPAPAPVNAAPPLPSGGISGFAYGAHVAGFGGTEIMAAIGMTWMKKQIRYNRGDNGAAYAPLINDVKSRGFRILLGVVGSPGDIAAGGDAYFAEYAAFVGGLAAAGADAIEVWNEPNLDREWPTGSVDPAQYTRLLALSYNAIKAANRGTIVISGAPAPTGFFGGCSPNGCDDRVYLQGMRAAGAAAYMDCVGAHYNEGVVGPRVRSGDPRSEYYTRYFGPMIDVYAGALGKPICFTELGYVTPDGYGGMPPGFEWGNNNTLSEQAQWLAEAIALSARDSRVRLVIVWNFNFVTDPNAADPSGGYAMLRPDGSCPACDAIRALR